MVMKYHFYQSLSNIPFHIALFAMIVVVIVSECWFGVVSDKLECNDCTFITHHIDENNTEMMEISIEIVECSKIMNAVVFDRQIPFNFINDNIQYCK